MYAEAIPSNHEAITLVRARYGPRVYVTHPSSIERMKL
jgi:hypothetical protein